MGIESIANYGLKAEVTEALGFVNTVTKSLEKYCGKRNAQLMQDYEQMLRWDIDSICEKVPTFGLLGEFKEKCFEQLGSLYISGVNSEKVLEFFQNMHDRLLIRKLELLEAGA